MEDLTTLAYQAVNNCWCTPASVHDIKQQLFFDTGMRFDTLEVCNAIRSLVARGEIIAEKRTITDPRHRFGIGYPHKLQPYVIRLLVFGPKSHYYKEQMDARRTA